MPAKNPRVNVVLGKSLYDSIRRLAAQEEISLSLKIRDLMKDALLFWREISMLCRT
jgi:hypothetical protein